MRHSRYGILQMMLAGIVGLFALLQSAHADAPFRNHRFHHFATLCPASGRTVFIGNSITNMHEWQEAFGSNSVLNRGVSGAVSDEIVDNLESYIIDHPAKVFLMIGTNDLGTQGMLYPEYPFQRIQRIVNRIQRESPATEIYVQSILPTTNGLRTADNIQRTNAMLKAYCQEAGVQYIDLYSRMVQAGTASMPSNYTYDNLHCTAMAYSAWCKAIEEQVGLASQYPANTQNKNNGLSGAYGMRLTCFAQLPVRSTDILMFGDELQHGGEWAELLGNANVKSRGAGWGYPGPDLSTLRSYTAGVLNGRTDNEAPAKIFLYAGTADLNAGTAVATVATNYETWVKDIKAKAPTSEIYIEALLPNSAAATNTDRYQPFNEQLRLIAERQGATFVDTYTPMVSGNNARSNYFQGNYLNGIGYAAMAEVLAPYVGNCSPLTVEQAQKNLELNTARNAVGQKLSQLESLHFGTTVGCYPNSAREELETAIGEAYTVLAKGSEASVEELEAQQTALAQALAAIMPTIVQPTVSTEGDEHWYTFCSTLRGARYIHANGVGSALTGGGQTNFARMMWKFVQRTDGSLDIVCRADGSYMSPTAAFNTSVTTTGQQPNAGWTLKPSSTPGMFIVVSGTVELNQTNLSGNPIYNWSSGQSGADITDTGCQFTIEDVTGTEPTEEPVDNTPGLITSLDDLQTGWYRMAHSANAAFSSFYNADALTGRYVYNGANEYRQNATNSYPLFLQPSAEKPNEGDATYYIRVERNGSNFYVQSADGHYLKTNATASRTAQDVTAFSYDSSNQSFGVGRYWVYFPSLEHIMGMSSNAAFATNRFKVYSVVPEDEGLEAWSVSIAGAANASEVINDTRITCNSTALSGLNKVYNGGHFFLQKGTIPERSDFTAPSVANKQTVIDIDATAHSIRISYESIPDAVTSPDALPSKDAKVYDPTGRPIGRYTRGLHITKRGKYLRKE